MTNKFHYHPPFSKLSYKNQLLCVVVETRGCSRKMRGCVWREERRRKEELTVPHYTPITSLAVAICCLFVRD